MPNEKTLTEGERRQRLLHLQNRMEVFYRLRGRLGSRAARRKAGLSQSDILTWQLVVAQHQRQQQVSTASLGQNEPAVAEKDEHLEVAKAETAELVSQ